MSLEKIEHKADRCGDNVVEFPNTKPDLFLHPVLSNDAKIKNNAQKIADIMGYTFEEAMALIDKL